MENTNISTPIKCQKLKMKTASETSTILQSNYIPIKKENVSSSKRKITSYIQGKFHESFQQKLQTRRFARYIQSDERQKLLQICIFYWVSLSFRFKER